MAEKRTILITGATGRQGGAVAAELAGGAFDLRALTRKPEGAGAAALAARGISIVPGDLDDPVSLRKALAGAWGVFAVQNAMEVGPEREEEQGKRFAELAREAGVRHFVYTSVASANRSTGIPHFESKSRIEDRVRELGFPSRVILRPVYFMENLVMPWSLQGDTLRAGLRPTTPLQMIAVADIGRYAARAFTAAEEMNGRELDLAGDELTLPAAAATLSRAMGRRIVFEPLPIEAVRARSEDLALMLDWFERVGYDVDIAALEREFGIPPTRFEAWAALQRADGPAH